MEVLGIPYAFRFYVRAFLSSRKAEVEVNGTKSRKITLNKGLPQEISISPVLFLIFINDIDVELNPETIRSLFADNTSICKCGLHGECNKKEEVRMLQRTFIQEEVDKMVGWADR